MVTVTYGHGIYFTSTASNEQKQHALRIKRLYAAAKSIKEHTRRHTDIHIQFFFNWLSLSRVARRWAGSLRERFRITEAGLYSPNALSVTEQQY